MAVVQRVKYFYAATGSAYDSTDESKTKQEDIRLVDAETEKVSVSGQMELLKKVDSGEDLDNP